MIRVDIDEAAARLSRLIEDAIQGREVVITRDDRDLVKLVPVEGSRASRRLGSAAGKIWISEDFDDPLPDFEEYE